MGKGSKHLNILLDRELDIAINHYATTRNISVSQAARTILRYGLALVKDGKDAGFREGVTAGTSKALAAIGEALKAIEK